MSAAIRVVAVLCVALIGYVSPVPQLASVTWTQDQGFRIVDGHLPPAQDAVARINFTNAINQTGWSFLEIQTSPAFPDKIQAYGAGYLEGYVTARLIHWHWLNTVNGSCNGMEKVCDRINDYFDRNTAWVKENTMTKNHSEATSDFWQQVLLVYLQMDGILDGYNARLGQDHDQPLTANDLMWINALGDIEDLREVFGEGQSHRRLGSGSCSVLIKLLPDNKDLYFGHNTWTGYNTMLRVLKKYSMPFRRTSSSSVVPGHTIAFSSYPGQVYSLDDFYLVSSGLAVTETTIENTNAELWKLIQPEGSLLVVVRSMVANRLATNGREWTSVFSHFNSGTYNNQWMVLDYRKFKPGRDLTGVRGLLWVMEQMPGYVHGEDLSHVLLNQTYWPSYNRPYFEDIYNMSGHPESVAKYGDWFSYDKTPRALIFRRDQGTVRDHQSMTRLMRYNDFQNDPLSRCNCSPPYSAENAIAARSDLNPVDGIYPFDQLGHINEGATDMKFTTSTLFRTFGFVAVSGPTNDDVPTFQWSTSHLDQKVSHFGHPDIWDFQPIVHQWAMNPASFATPLKKRPLRAFPWASLSPPTRSNESIAKTSRFMAPNNRPTQQTAAMSSGH